MGGPTYTPPVTSEPTPEEAPVTTPVETEKDPDILTGEIKPEHRKDLDEIAGVTLDLSKGLSEVKTYEELKILFDKFEEASPKVPTMDWSVFIPGFNN